MNNQLVTTIGLEIHVELKTLSKMFCSCAVGFGGEPNSRVCPVCLGHPGTLPVPNRAAIEFTTKIALALGCEIADESVFHRKNYFYPDMPKNYQITQYDVPIGSGGSLEIDGTRIGITRVHLEEDTGKTVHVGGGGRIHEAEYSLEDFNRAGTPLVEIVTEPDLTSPGQSRLFAQELRLILQYLDVSDVRMEEGSLRVDANISVAQSGEKGVKVEVKNMNSLRSVERALAYEQKRLTKLLEADGETEQATRHWDEEAGVTRASRSKEYAFDYRYFPEPDLVPLTPSAQWVSEIEQSLPDLPDVRRGRLVNDLKLSSQDAEVLTSSKKAGDFFEAALASSKAEAKQVANWVVNDLAGVLSQAGSSFEELTVKPQGFATLLDMVADGSITAGQGQEILEVMVAEGGDAREIAKSRGLEQVSDTSAIEAAVDRAIAGNQDVVQRIRSGDDKPLGFLVGQVMKEMGGKANPKLVNEILRKRVGIS